MNIARLFGLVLLCSLPVFAQTPPAQAPHAQLPPESLQRAGELRVLGYLGRVPVEWQPQPTTARYRVGQYRVPGMGGDGELVVFYFGRGQGGSIPDNIERWVSQFGSPDGKPVVPKVAKFNVDDLPVTTVELAGSYGRNTGMGPTDQMLPDRILMVAIAETPFGNLTIQLHGPRATIEAARGAFDVLAHGLKKEPPR